MTVVIYRKILVNPSLWKETQVPDNNIRLGISQEWCGFVRNTGTRNVVFIIRMLSEQTIDKVEHLYFID